MKKYLVLLTAITSILAIIILLLSGRFEHWQQMVCWFVLGYFFVVTFLSHLGLERSMRSRPQAFVRYYMGSTSLRLLAHLMVIVIYSMFNQPHAKFFIITFLILYFAYTIFEVGYVMKMKKS